MPSVLIVEDEAKIARLLADYFTSEGYSTTILSDGDRVIEWLRNHEVDAVLLDLMLPGKDGITICKELRGFSDVPVLMVTARVDEIDRLLGLEIGADDYICKPFSPREVVARVKVILRRLQPGEQANAAWQLDDGRYEFKFENGAVALTATEFQLIKRLCSEPGRIFSRDQLMRVMYDDHRIVSPRTVDSHVKKLRAKLGASFPANEFIESVYGIGYRFTG